MGQLDLFFQSKLYIHAWSYSLKILPKKDKEHLPTISTIILTKENIDFKYRIFSSLPVVLSDGIFMTEKELQANYELF